MSDNFHDVPSGACGGVGIICIPAARVCRPRVARNEGPPKAKYLMGMTLGRQY